MRALLAVVAVVAVGRVAAAYPQFQLSKDQTCTSCHLSPAGGLLLDENGLGVAETISRYGGTPEAFHGKLDVPSWLELGGDLRAGAGLVYDRGPHPAGFPMQGDVDAAAHGGAWTFLATGGFQQGHSALTVVASREHWLMWQPTGDVYLRAGRFMPVYGLRRAEHDEYTRRYGQTPLYGETYGAAIEVVDPAWELHVTGFVHDPIQYTAELGNGAAAYGEGRIAQIASVGLEGRYAKSDEDARLAGGATAKLWLDPVLFEGEAQVVRQTFAAGGKRTQIVSYVVASWFVKPSWMLDVGAGQFDEDTSVKGVGVEGVDANLHWFTTSHWEFLWTNRVETRAGFSLLQFHYRI